MQRREKRTVRVLILCALLIGVPTVVILLATQLGQRSAVRTIEQSGGFVVFHFYGPGWLERMLGDRWPFSTPEVVNFGMAATDQDVSQLRLLKQTRSVDLSGTKLGGSGFAYLNALPRLESLYLVKANIPEEGLRSLGQLKRIKTLALSKSDITDEGLARLTGLLSLEDLDLARTRITDEGLRQLQSISNMTMLSLEETRVTDVGLGCLGGLRLKELNVRRTSVTSTRIAELLAKNPGIKIVR